MIPVIACVRKLPRCHEAASSSTFWSNRVLDTLTGPMARN